MERCDGPPLDTCNKNSISKILVPLYEVSGRLLGWNSNEWDSLVSGFEPNNFRFILRSVGMMAARGTFSGLPFGFLFLFRRLAARAK